MFFFLLWISYSASAQAEQIFADSSKTSQEEQQQEIPEDPLGRRTPQGTVEGFIRSVAAQDYAKASRYLVLDDELRNNQEAERLAKLLQKLLDQSGNIIPYSLISKDPDGRADDDFPKGVDKVGEVSIDGEEIPLKLEKLSGPNGYPLWLFSSETINSISDVSIDETANIDRILPGFLEDSYWGGVPVGHWLAIVLLIVLAYFLSWAIVKMITFLIPKLWAKARLERTEGIIKALALPIQIYLAVWLFVILSEKIDISIIVRQSFSGLTIIIGLAAFLLLLWRLADFISNFSKRRMSLRGNISGVSIVLFLRRAAKVAIIVFGFIAILGILGVNVTAGLAALGIGGIALALGAQKTIENFVGSVTLITDQPIRVGDFCKVGDTVGTVEQIGMRSTRIRTLQRTIVTIPNGEFSSTRIENYAHRDRFLFNPILELRYETTPDQVRFLLVELREMLYAHPMVNPDPARVRFIGFGTAALNVEFFAYINASNFDEYLEVKEDVLLRIMDIVALSGTDFAFPSQTLYFAKDKGVSPEKAVAAEERVKKWRENEELQLPAFDQEKIKKVKDTIPYPPEGSVKRKIDK
ncbi:MAG TPA: mechanosensitive ion channel domain-containing protein [Salinimicrobium sp.]|nr:mechanosensitive ion channel domain-containing protein [Salinimicrobium sp.]